MQARLSARNRVMAEAEPTPWGEFGGVCLVGATSFSPELVLPGCHTLGLDKAWSALLGTWRDAAGVTYRLLRVMDGCETRGVTYFSSQGGQQLERGEESSALYAAEITVLQSGGEVSYRSPTHRQAAV